MRGCFLHPLSEQRTTFLSLMFTGMSATYKKERVGCSCSRDGGPGGNPPGHWTLVQDRNAFWYSGIFLQRVSCLELELTPQFAAGWKLSRYGRVKGQRPPFKWYSLSRPEDLQPSAGSADNWSRDPPTQPTGHLQGLAKSAS